VDRIIKVVTWRAISVILTVTLVWIITGSAEMATGIALAIHFVLVFAHYAFETLWDKLED